MGKVYSRERWRGGHVPPPVARVPRREKETATHRVLSFVLLRPRPDSRAVAEHIDCACIECETMQTALEESAALLRTSENELAALQQEHAHLQEQYESAQHQVAIYIHISKNEYKCICIYINIHTYLYVYTYAYTYVCICIS